MELNSIILFTFVMYFVSTCSCSTEPVCSKFPYDEALLERTIRTEFKMEKLQDTFQELSDNVKDSLAMHQDNFVKLSNTVTGKISEIANTSEDFVEKVEAKLTEKSEFLEVKMGLMKKNMNETLQKELGNMKQEVATLFGQVRKLQQLKDDGNKPTVAFKAYKVSNTKPSVGDTLVFKTDILNEGGAYSRDTGVFTAPYTGLYFFTVQMGTGSRSVIACSIMVEQREVGRVYTRGASNYASSSSDAIAMVMKGDRVFVKTKAMSGYLSQDSNMMISFSGMLMQ